MGPREQIAILICCGLDSAILIAWGADNGYDQQAFFIDYGQNNLDQDLACARITPRSSAYPWKSTTSERSGIRSLAGFPSRSISMTAWSRIRSARSLPSR